ncbi:TPA: hypothetical protein ACGHLA_000547 [Salmonella enterica subsp. enterica serovar Bovismorbificans]
MKAQRDEPVNVENAGLDVQALKRHAVAQVFWPAGPVDDDFCYDKIISSACINQTFQDENALFLFKPYKNMVDNKDIQPFLESKYQSLYSIVSDKNGLDIGKVKKAAVERFFWTTDNQGADGGYDKILNSHKLNKFFLYEHNLYIHEPYDKLLDSAGLKKSICDEAVAIASLHPNFTPELIEHFYMTRDNNSIINNAIDIAKIEAEVDTLCKLSELDLIDKTELDNRLGDAVVKFLDLYDKGGIDSKFSYDMARELSNKIEKVDSGDGWWTLNFEEAHRGEGRLTLEKVIAESKVKQEVIKEKLERESKSGNTPSKCFDTHLEGSFAVLNEEYEKRYTSLISGIDAKSCLVLTDSIHFVNQINDLKPGSSEFDERISFLASGSKLTPVVISGEDYLNWFEKNKDQVIELYKMEDATSYAAEAEAGQTPGTWYLFEEKMMKTIETMKSLLNDLRTKGTEHSPATGHTLADEHVAGNRPHSPV